MLYFFSENIEKPEYQTLYFDVKYVHLNDDSIKIGDEIKTVIPKIKKFLKLNGLIYLLIMAGLGIIISALVISYVEKMNYGDSLWWAFVTATTVGYGDISPKTYIGRFVAIFLMLIGIGTFGMITGTIATYFLNKQNDIAPNDDLDKYILNSENFSDSEKKEIITFIHFIKSKREK